MRHLAPRQRIAGRSRPAAASALPAGRAAAPAPALLALLIAPPDGAGQQPAGRPIAFPQGWSDAERREFYHLSLGGEIFPVAWTRALTSVATRRPFLEGLDRFGFLDDPDGPGHLPIGLTGDRPVREAGTPGPPRCWGSTARPATSASWSTAARRTGSTARRTS